MATYQTTSLFGLLSAQPHHSSSSFFLSRKTETKKSFIKMYSKSVYLTSAIVVVLASGAFAVPVSSRLHIINFQNFVFLCVCNFFNISNLKLFYSYSDRNRLVHHRTFWMHFHLMFNVMTFQWTYQWLILK